MELQINMENCEFRLNSLEQNNSKEEVFTYVLKFFKLHPIVVHLTLTTNTITRLFSRQSEAEEVMVESLPLPFLERVN